MGRRWRREGSRSARWSAAIGAAAVAAACQISDQGLGGSRQAPRGVVPPIRADADAGARARDAALAKIRSELDAAAPDAAGPIDAGGLDAGRTPDGSALPPSVCQGKMTGATCAPTSCDGRALVEHRCAKNGTCGEVRYRCPGICREGRCIADD